MTTAYFHNFIFLLCSVHSCWFCFFPLICFHSVKSVLFPGMLPVLFLLTNNLTPAARSCPFSSDADLLPLATVLDGLLQSFPISVFGLKGEENFKALEQMQKQETLKWSSVVGFFRLLFFLWLSMKYLQKSLLLTRVIFFLTWRYNVVAYKNHVTNASIIFSIYLYINITLWPLRFFKTFCYHYSYYYWRLHCLIALS